MRGQMLAARAYEGERHFRLERIDIPEPSPEDVLVKVEAAGLTRGLLSLWRRGNRIKLLPATLGQEAAGTVAEVGAEVDGFQVGQRVRVHAPVTCRNCYFCATDNEPLCEAVFVIGHAFYGPAAMPMYRRYHNGGLAEYVKVPAANLDPLPDPVDFDVASRLHSLAVGFRTLRKAQLDHGATVVINGATGATGAAAVKCAPLFGVARMILVSRTRGNLEKTAALEPGVPADLIALEELGDLAEERGGGWQAQGPLTEAIMAATGGRGADGLVDFLPAQPLATQQAILGLRKGGKAVLSGGNWEQLSFRYGAIMQRNLEIKGSNGFTRRDARELLALLAAGRMDVSELITHRLSLKDVNDAVDLIDSRSGGPLWIVLQP